GRRGHRSRATVARPRLQDGHPLPHGEGRDRQQGRRSPGRRRRLRDEAVQPRGARRPRAGDPAAHVQRAARRRPQLRRPHARRDPPRGLPRRDARPADRDRVQPPPLLPAQPEARALEGADPPERLALRLRGQLQRRRDLCQLPAQEARRGRPAADQDRSAGGLHARQPGLVPRVLRRLSLRTRLVLGLLVLALVGLVAADFATYKSLSSFLFDRVDSTLNAAHPPVESAILPEGQFGGGPNPSPGRNDIDDLLRAIPGDCVQVRTLAGAVVSGKDTCVPQFGQTTHPPKPDYPRNISLPSHSAGTDNDRVRFLTVPAESGGGRYRVRASIEGRSPNYVLLIAAPLNSVDSTLHRLFLIELLVTAAVLGALIALALWVVRLGLRPLVAIEHTAAAIGAGDLSQRVERAEPRTEIGR